MITKALRLANYLNKMGLNKESDYLSSIISLAAPLGDILDVDEDMAKQMEELEEIYFGPYGREESADEILDDLHNKENVTGVIYKGDKEEDSDQIKGYLYGFKYDLWEHDIDWHDFECFDKECEEKEHFAEAMQAELESENVLYVSNLLVEKRYRHKVIEIINGFFEKVRASRVDYVVFDAMPKTFNMIMKDGRPNPLREQMFRLKVIGKTGYDAFLVKVLR